MEWRKYPFGLDNYVPLFGFVDGMEEVPFWPRQLRIPVRIRGWNGGSTLLAPTTTYPYSDSWMEWRKYSFGPDNYVPLFGFVDGMEEVLFWSRQLRIPIRIRRWTGGSILVVSTIMY